MTGGWKSLECCHNLIWVNSLWPSDAIWRHSSGSTLAWHGTTWHQAISWTNVDSSSVKSCGINLRAVLSEKSRYESKLLPHLPWTNELTCPSICFMIHCRQGFWLCGKHTIHKCKWQREQRYSYNRPLYNMVYLDFISRYHRPALQI